MVNNEEFVRIPNFSKYVINVNGVVINTVTGKERKFSFDGNGYLTLIIEDDRGIKRRCSQHRLLCHTFKGLDIYNTGIHVNHINGIKTDNRLDNLECVSPRENNYHAGRQGLTSKCIPCKIKNFLTGEIIHFPSANEASIYLNLSRDIVLSRIGSDRVINGVSIKREDDESDWVELPSYYPTEVINTGSGKQVAINNVFTNETIFFGLFKNAADHLNVSSSVITNYANSDFNKLFIIYNQVIRVQTLDNYIPWKKIDDVYLELSIQGNVIPVCYKERDVRIYLSCVECASDMKISPTCLNHRLKSKFNSIYSDGYRYGYYIDFINIGPCV